MSKYTMAERHEIYKKALEEKRFMSGLCYSLLNASNSVGGSWKALELFPEFALFENKIIGSSYWFGSPSNEESNDIREAVLEFCIYMTA